MWSSNELSLPFSLCSLDTNTGGQASIRKTDRCPYTLYKHMNRQIGRQADRNWLLYNFYNKTRFIISSRFSSCFGWT